MSHLASDIRSRSAVLTMIDKARELGVPGFAAAVNFPSDQAFGAITARFEVTSRDDSRIDPLRQIASDAIVAACNNHQDPSVTRVETKHGLTMVLCFVPVEKSDEKVQQILQAGINFAWADG